MELTFNQCNFLLDLLKSYKNNLYLEMRKQNYLMENILQFISGYELMCDWISYHLTRIKKEVIELKSVFHIPPFSDYQVVIFGNEDDAVNFITNMVYLINNGDYSKWEDTGMKYVLCLAKYYIQYVLTGKDTDMTPGYLYIELPDKDNPEEYDWEEHGINFNQEVSE